MSDFDPKSMSIDQLIEHFAGTGIAQDKALLYDEFDDFQKHYDEMVSIREELMRRGVEARLALRQLYNHKNFQVRLQAARFSLAVDPVAARKVVEEIANSRHYPQAGDAGMCLFRLHEDGYKHI